FGDSGGYPSFRGNVAVTALGGLAFLAGGHQPDRGAYGAHVAKAPTYVLSQASAIRPGFLYPEVASSPGPMYSHGFGSLFLAAAARRPTAASSITSRAAAPPSPAPPPASARFTPPASTRARRLTRRSST